METTNFDYFMTAKDTSVLKNLSKMGDHLLELKAQMEEAEAKATLAKQEYEHYANSILPTLMHTAGVESLQLANGGFMTVNRAYYCSPNKNDADQQVLANWLKANDGDFLIETQVATNEESIDLLKKNDIPYVEKTSVNTAKLKSFIKDKLGITSGVAQITMEDIPKCLHFQEVTTVEIKTN